MKNIHKNISKQFLWIIIFSGIFLFWAKNAKAIISNYPCESETQCKNICVGNDIIGEDIVVVEITTGFGGKEYYCTKGYIPGSVGNGGPCYYQTDCKAGYHCFGESGNMTCRVKLTDRIGDGGPCYYQTDCIDGYYCFGESGSMTCRAKIADGTRCDSENVCRYSCKSGKSYLVSDPYNGGVGDYYMCGTDPSASDTEIISSQIANGLVPGSTDITRGIVPCGRGGQRMCTLCDLIVGIHVIIKFIMKIAIGVALLAIAIGGVMYVVSAGDSGAVETAKATIKSALIGFIVIFAAWIIVNTVMTFLSANSTLGMKSTTSWQNFECNATNK